MVSRGKIVADKYMPLLKVVDQYVHESEVNKIIEKAVNEEIELIADFVNQQEECNSRFISNRIMDGDYCK